MNLINKNNFTIYSRLWDNLSRKRKQQLLILVFLTILTSFLEVLGIGALLPFLSILTNPSLIYNNIKAKFIINYFSIGSNTQLMYFISFSFIIILFISGLMRVMLVWFQTRLSFNILSDISINIFYRTMYQKYEIHIARNSSDLISGISSKANSLVSNMIMPTILIFNSILMIIMIASALIYVNFNLTIYIITTFGLVYLVIVQKTKKQLAKDSIKLNYESNKVIKILQESLGSIRDVLINGTQKNACDIFKLSDLSYRRAQANQAIILNTPRLIIETLFFILIVLFGFLLSLSSEGLVNNLPILGVLALGIQRLLPIFNQLFSSWSMIKGGNASILDTLDLLEQPLPTFFQNANTKQLVFNEKIEINNLSFRYNNTSESILRNIDLLIKKGDRVGFIGNTGSGKSTLLDNIMGLLQAYKGDILIDDVKIDAENINSWQTNISHVPQSIFLSDSSIAENIAFGIPKNEIDFDRVKIAAEKAQISQTIDIWEKKYQTIVGERGVKLSGGQRQRIGIARALYKNASVIVFDEATSALDNETESEVMNSINHLDKSLTILIVAHRLSTLKNCDYIVEISNGIIINKGDYNKIIESKK
jgi:ABC-type multidrug transport system fused ATPase/permease subunit